MFGSSVEIGHRVVQAGVRDLEDHHPARDRRTGSCPRCSSARRRCGVGTKQMVAVVGSGPLSDPTPSYVATLNGMA